MAQPEVDPAKRGTDTREVMQDKVPATRIYRVERGPGRQPGQRPAAVAGAGAGRQQGLAPGQAPAARREAGGRHFRRAGPRSWARASSSWPRSSRAWTRPRSRRRSTRK
jgi:hypothetical protein